jgi:predicted kinase
MDKRTLYLFVGYPGTGKTTVAKIIHETTGAVHLWADQVRQQVFGKPTLSAEQTAELYAKLNDMTAQLLDEGKSVIFDTNFNFYNDRESLRALANQHSADMKLIWMTTPKDLARTRAVEDTMPQDTRIWGSMALGDFERISNNLQPPKVEEQAIELDGTNIDADVVKQKLGL